MNILEDQKTVETLPFEDEIKKLPELEKGKNLWQNNFHEFDVYEHTLKFVEFVKQLARDGGRALDPNIVAAAYLHDIGKPVVATEKIRDGVLLEKEPGKPYHEFTDHEVIGEQMVRAMDPEFFIKNGLDQEKVAKLVGAHYLPMENIKEMRKTKTYADFITKYHDLEQKLDETGLTRAEVIELFLADSYSKGKGCTDLAELMKAREVILSGRDDEKIRELYDMQKTAYGGKD